MLQRSAVVASPAGLHARPASELVSTANQFTSTISISVADKPAVDAKSILMVMSLGAAQGAEVQVSVDGQDEAAAIDAVVRTIETDYDS